MHCGKTWLSIDGEQQCGLAQGHKGVCIHDPGRVLPKPVYVGDSGGELKAGDARLAEPQVRRHLMYMMHPLGGGPDRERNRKLACLWQAELQRAHPEWIILAPWIGLSGAWGEDLRDLGMEVDFATIDICHGGIITGPLDGPMKAIVHGRTYEGVSPGMAAELAHFGRYEPQQKPILDARTLFKVSLPLDVPKKPSDYKPRFQRFEPVYVENKPGGVCHVKDVEETAPGVFRYLIERTETFFAHEQSLAKAPHAGSITGPAWSGLPKT